MVCLYGVHVYVPALWLRTIILLDRGQKLKFQKIRDRGGGMETSTQTNQRTEMEVKKGDRTQMKRET